MSIALDHNEDNDIPVLLEDQEKITHFSKLDFKRKNLIEEANLFKEEIQRLCDASEEVALCMDLNGLLLKVGESFVHGLDETEINDYIEEQQKKIKQKFEKTEDDIQIIVNEMNEIKLALYVKFGTKRINLEFD